MASTEGLVPITRASLARYYDKYPLPSLSDDVPRLTAELRVFADELLRELAPTIGEFFLSFFFFIKDLRFLRFIC